VPDIGNPSTIPFWQRIVMCVYPKEAERFIPRSGYFAIFITYYSNIEIVIYICHK